MSEFDRRLTASDSYKLRCLLRGDHKIGLRMPLCDEILHGGISNY